MESIFKLAEKQSDLSSLNQGISKYWYDKRSPVSNITDPQPTGGTIISNFASGPQSIRFSGGSNDWWIPSRSFLKIRAQLGNYNAAGITPLQMNSNTAPAMHMASTFWKAMQFRIADKTVSDISEYFPQVSVYKNRLYKTNNWLESVGASSNFDQANAFDRQSQVCKFVKNQNPKGFYRVDGPANGNVNGWDALVRGLDPADTIQLNIPVNPVDPPSTTKIEFISILATSGRNLSDIFPVCGNGDYLQLYNTSPSNSTVNSYYFAKIIGIQSVPSTGLLTVITYITLDTQIITANFGPIAINGSSLEPTLLRPIYEPINRQVEWIELTYRPPLSIFSYQGALPMSAMHELFMQPEPNYMNYCTESVNANALANNSYYFRIQELYLQLCRCEGPRLESKEFYIDLDEIGTNTQPITYNSVADGNGVYPYVNQNITFSVDIKPSTYALTLAFQSNAALSATNNLESITKFQIPNVNAENNFPNNFPIYDDGLTLTRYYYEYAGQHWPNPDGDLLVTSSLNPQVSPATNSASYLTAPAIQVTDYMQEQYYRNLLNIGSYWDANAESEDEWREKGPFYYQTFAKTGSDRSTIAQLHIELNTTQAARAITFYHYKKVCAIKIDKGQIVDATVTDV